MWHIDVNTERRSIHIRIQTANASKENVHVPSSSLGACETTMNVSANQQHRGRRVSVREREQSDDTRMHFT